MSFLCYIYHIVNKPVPDFWYHFIHNKLQVSHLHKYSNEIAELSKYSLEFVLREHFKKLFVEKSDRGHETWKNNLKFMQYIQSPVSKNYWLNLKYYYYIQLNENIPNEYILNKYDLVKRKPRYYNYCFEIDVYNDPHYENSYSRQD